MPGKCYAAFVSAVGDDQQTEFMESFDGFARAVRRARGSTTPANGHGLTLSQYALLQPLSDGGCARVRELADQAGISPSTATRILDVLERREIVVRAREHGDRRAVEVTLTERGAEVLDSEDEWLRGRRLAYFQSLAPDQRRLAPELLEGLASLIDELARSETP
jgi:DNA-binding MarR family transcriptional regulator